MVERNLAEEMNYTVGLKVVMSVLEQIRQYHYLDTLERDIMDKYSEVEFICDLNEVTIEADDISVLVHEIYVRKSIVLRNFRKCIGNLMLLPSSIQREFLHKDYYYNQELIEDVAKLMDKLIKQTSPFDAFDVLVDYMKSYGES